MADKEQSKRNRQEAAARARVARAAKRGKTKERPYAGGRTSERLRAVRQLLGEGWQPGDIKRSLADKLGVDERTVATYIAMVREENKRTYEEIRASNDYVGTMLARWEAHYAASMRARQYNAAARALNAIEELTGCASAKRIELSGVNGAPIETVHRDVIEIDYSALSDEELLAVGRVLKLDAAREEGGDGSGEAG